MAQDSTNRLISLEQYKQDILLAYRLKETVVSSDSALFSDIDNGYRKQLFPDYDYTAYFNELISQVLPEQPVEFRDNFGLYFIIWQEKSDTALEYHFIGPYLYQLPFNIDDTESYNHFAESKHIPEEGRNQVIGYFSQITVVQDMSVWKILTALFFSTYFNKTITIPTIDYDNRTGTPLLVNSASKEGEAVNYKAIEARYLTEKKMMDAITRGDTAAALRYHHEFMGFTLETRGSTELSSAKMYIIAANTSMRKAVEAAQVHPLYIDQISGQLHIEIENAKSQAQLNHINTDMIRRYCTLVQTYSRSSFSPVIRDCLNYIDFHFQEPISLQYLAEKFSVTKNHLSSQFHKEVNLTITEYINTTRVRQALYLLSTTALSMENIAEQCGFSDSNYFARTFKKIQGLPPHQYRKSLRNQP